jgi:sterol desaturase/sphingolipid hydroxylase (fatty acid hydroxylase superfamily)
VNEELKAYLGLEAKVSAAFNFFINGMIIALIYHKADLVTADTFSLSIDLIITCLSMFILTALFCKASLRRTKITGILPPGSQMMRRLSRLYRRPVLFGTVLGLAAAMALIALAAPVLALTGLKAIPFGIYVALKSTGCALLGSAANQASLYAGMHRAA